MNSYLLIYAKALANPYYSVLPHFSSELYLRNGAPPLRVAVNEALHHPITALPVGILPCLIGNAFFYDNVENIKLK